MTSPAREEPRKPNAMMSTGPGPGVSKSGGDRYEEPSAASIA